nr:hypothetical protein [Nocardia tengchongensis]
MKVEVDVVRVQIEVNAQVVHRVVEVDESRPLTVLFTLADRDRLLWAAYPFTFDGSAQ